MCHFSNQGGMGTGNPSMTLQEGGEKGFVAPSLALYHNLYPTLKPRLLHRLFNLFLFCAYNKAVTATRISQADEPRVVLQP